MLSVYEYQTERATANYFCPRKLVISYTHSGLELHPTYPQTTSLLAFSLTGDGKMIVQLGLSPHQVRRIARYLEDQRWEGGTLMPWSSEPDCSILNLTDLPQPESDPRESVKYGKWGLGFHLDQGNILIEWEPEDREGASKALASLAREAYLLRKLEPEKEETPFDVELWKRHLFD